MKLAGFGLIVGAVGLITGIDGLLLAGGFWVVTGLLIRALVQRSESSFSVDAGVETEVGRIEGRKTRTARFGAPGLVLLVLTGIGSIAIGILGLGFSADHESLRWIPFAVGVLITFIALISIPVEAGWVKAEPGSADSASQGPEAAADCGCKKIPPRRGRSGGVVDG